MTEDKNQHRINVSFVCSMGVIALFLGFVPTLLGFASKGLYSLPQWLQLVLLTVPLQGAYLCAVLIPAKKIQGEIPLKEQLELSPPRNPLKTFALVSVGVFAMYPLLAIVTLLYKKLLVLLHVNAPAQSLVLLIGSADFASVAVIVFTAVLLAPFAEELVFRHAVYRKFEHIAPPFGAACVSALLFGLSHFNILTFPALFLLALFLQFVFVKTKSLSCAIYAHALYNLISTVLLLFMRFGILPGQITQTF